MFDFGDQDRPIGNGQDRGVGGHKEAVEIRL
jgi:hypothetical protein